MDPSQVGRVLERLRREAGLTQATLAARIGTTQAALSKIETGRTMPGLDLLDRIARAVGRPITLTLGEDAVPPSREARKGLVRRALGDFASVAHWPMRRSLVPRGRLAA